jgi:C4-dicarboxylate-specific signal transduction histidine kinase
VQSKLAADRSDVNVELDLQASLFIAADVTQVEIVLSELFRNSLFAIRGTGAIRIAAERVPSAMNLRHEVVRMTWSDTGPGLNGLEREHLFDPFFSGRPAGRGLGFGLSKCWRILSTHGGSIRVASSGENVESPGLTLVVEWPVFDNNNGPPRRGNAE